MYVEIRKIKDVIGPGDHHKIRLAPGVKIDIENDGRVFIAAPDGAARRPRRSWDLVRDVESARSTRASSSAS